MMNELEKIELIEAHHYRQLTDQEQTMFEELLAADKEFADAVQAYEHLFDGLDMLHLEDFEARIQLWETRCNSNESAQPPATLQIHKGGSAIMSPKRWYIAAACMLLAPAAYFGIMHQTQYQRTFAAYFAPAPAIVMEAYRSNLSDTNTQIELLKQAIHFYNDGDYTQALPLLESYAKNNAKDARIALYLGVCRLSLGQTDAAIDDLQLSAQSTDDNLADSRAEAQWTLALAYLRKKDLAQCKTLLQQIVNQPNHNYQSQAAQLLNEL